MKLSPITYTFVFALSLIHATASATEGYSVKHIATAPVLDGIIDEPVWQQALRVELKYEQYPGPGNPAKTKTIAYMYEDGERLYLAFYAYDPEPNKIRAHLADRDEIGSDDRVGVTLDTFNGEREAYEFYVNPYGVQNDGRMEDFDGWQGNDAWNSIWYSAAKIHEDGWSAEISIPFKALRFPKTDGPLTWGIAFFRAYPRELSYWLTDYPAERTIRCNLCQFHKTTGFKSIKPGKNLQFTPTLTFGKSETRDDIPGDWQSEGIEHSTGLDMRWGVTQSSVVNATINPDFSQVEADAAQLDVNKNNSLFLEEQRAFFLDGADYFSTSKFNLVHTRNIADPDLGIKYTGKTGTHSYGVILANDNLTNFIIPSNQGSEVAEYTEQDDDETPIGSNIAIARYKKDVGERSNIGGMITQRSADKYSNSVATVDGISWLSEFDAISYQLAYSNSKNPLSIQEEYDLNATQKDHALLVEYMHDTRDYKIEAKYRNVGEDFRADMGFLTFVDTNESSIKGELKYYGGANDFIAEQNYSARFKNIVEQDGRQLIRESKFIGKINAGWQSELKIGFTSRERLVETDFNPGGDYLHEKIPYLILNATPKSWFDFRIHTHYGDLIDFKNAQLGRDFMFKSGVTFNAGEHIKIDVNYNYRTMNVDAIESEIEGTPITFESGKLYTANQIDLRFNYQFDIRSKLKFVMLHTDLDRNADLYRANFDSDVDNNVDAVKKNLSTQLIYSYKINSQSLFYLGYSDSGYQDDALDNIEQDSRAVFAKLSYAWQN